ncbi:DsbE family thiol:disulfide interchange protein [Pleionea sediminis]|uniref:DsbE family thiol:disulfide interchange protein n=1 Tax=Pleionea sediminis TaxID=2569479 RepID=UPI001187269C|nr:DsbE family thiol:disulfide interchange protein [Pleionea sediminis]
MSDSEAENTLKQWAVPIFILFVLLFGLFGWSLFHDKDIVPKMREHKPLPEFQSKKLFSDQIIYSKDIRGEYWMLNFWGSWCPTCYVEHPYLMQLKSQGVKIVGVNYKDTEKDAKRFLDSQGNPYAFSFFDPKGKIAIEMGVTAAPETFVIGPKGKVVYHRIGEMTKEIFTQEIQPIMQGES